MPLQYPEKSSAEQGIEPMPRQPSNHSGGVMPRRQGKATFGYHNRPLQSSPPKSHSSWQVAPTAGQ